MKHNIIVPIQYNIFNDFLNKTNDYKIASAMALIWSYIQQNYSFGNKNEDFVEFDFHKLKELFNVSTTFVNQISDIAKELDYIAEYNKDESGTFKFYLNATLLENEVFEEPAKKESKKGKKGRGEYSEAFLEAFSFYPKRHRSSPKKPAFAAWNARIKEGISTETLTKAIKNYAKECKKDGKIGTPFVQLPQTFLGPNEQYTAYLDDIEEPSKETSNDNIDFIHSHSKNFENDAKTFSGVKIDNNTDEDEKRRKFLEQMSKKRI